MLPLFCSLPSIHSPVSLLPKIYILPPNEQILFYRLLTDGLYKRGLLSDQLMNTVNNLLPSLPINSRVLTESLSDYSSSSDSIGGVSSITTPTTTATGNT
ncbi:unnamed protein product [Heterobilharzia americana]|nr:unnamed protein product [Heterobilharzia americana]CAH8607111.1 unnamed protein product [Heterobilharzia americana]